ncbi:hypothetical protein DFQ05_1026 [Winogradskyella wandonensis]|uniref:Uncharacterized protein n=1 Tax=Winogradskyella wandonensis TaxID=1442586 RepID=A0A4R1KRQ9_9FLAO|nr:hypothetical protein [Winogradskyella wandonensis]TCK67253.1 hypothetical protein DFQ05_1026 [Winogradskyella wandonensis]
MKQTLTVRVEEDIKTHIENLANQYSITSSEYLRGIIEQHLIDNDLIEEQDDFVDVHELEEIVIFVDSWHKDIKDQLPKLTLWLFITKYSHNYCSLDILSNIKNYLENAVKSTIITPQLRFEFVKVLNNINIVIHEQGNLQNLQFTQAGNMYSLDYHLLFTAVYNLIDNNYAG